ncbi:hypothetical protein D3C75_1156940 [compost metagenome]
MGGIQQRYQPAIGKPFIGSGLRGGGVFRRAQAVQLMAIIHHQPTGFISRQQALVKLAGQGGRLGVERLQLVLLRVTQPGTGQNKPLVQFLNQPQGLGIRCLHLARVVNSIHPGKKRVI